MESNRMDICNLLLEVEYEGQPKSNKGNTFVPNLTTFSVTPVTVGYIASRISNNRKDPGDVDLNDSTNPMYDKTRKIKSITISYRKVKKQGAFYPYLNKCPSIDLSIYGIHHNFSIDNYKDNCFIEALKNSNQFTEDELNYARCSIHTRILRIKDLKEICKSLHFTLRVMYEDNHYDDINKGQSKFIMMWLYKNHYFIHLKDSLCVTSFYLQNYQHIDTIFPNDPTRFQITSLNPLIKTNQTTNIINLIKIMHENNLLVPIPDKEQAKVWMNYNNNLITTEYKDIRPIKIIAKNKNQERKRHKFRLENSEVSTLFSCGVDDKIEFESLYNKLQSLLCCIHVNVDVTHYKHYPELMQKIMYEYGCFDDVYEVTESLANKIKSEFVYPAPHTADRKPFYSKETLYYVDLNGAYMAAIDGIPTGPNLDGPKNTKICNLRDDLFKLRQIADTKVINRTIKNMMNSCWGYSARKPKTTKKYRPSDINKFIEENLEYVLSYDDKYVELINPVVVHYSYPQFAKRVLDNYHMMMDKIRRFCTVFYENIDAVLITESDYNKLLSKGLIGDEIGQFKIEHVFKEIAIKSPRCIMGIESNGEIFRRSTKIESMEEFLKSFPMDIATIH